MTLTPKDWKDIKKAGKIVDSQDLQTPKFWYEEGFSNGFLRGLVLAIFLDAVFRIILIYWD